MCNNPSELENLVDDIMFNYKVNIHCQYGDGNSWKKIINFNFFIIKINEQSC